MKLIGMGGICIQCALVEFVGLLEQGIDPMLAEGMTGGRFEGDPWEHMKRLHPDRDETQRERTDLERRAAIAFAKLRERAIASAKNAQNN